MEKIDPTVHFRIPRPLPPDQVISSMPKVPQDEVGWCPIFKTIRLRLCCLLENR